MVFPTKSKIQSQPGGDVPVILAIKRIGFGIAEAIWLDDRVDLGLIRNPQQKGRKRAADKCVIRSARIASIRGQTRYATVEVINSQTLGGVDVGRVTPQASIVAAKLQGVPLLGPREIVDDLGRVV